MSGSRAALLDTARLAALAAGEAIMRVYAQDFDVRQKADKTPVTEADLAAERIIIDMLEAAFPEIPVFAEELVEAEGLPPAAARFWAVDPLDGTREFVAKNGEFAVCIGLIEDGRPVLGVLHGPAVGLTYAARGPGTATRQRAGGAIEPIEARVAAADGLVIVHSRSHENSRRLGEFLQD
ncbi:MAG: 3'(2'),5'-bisphosphate nucleotidase CysQ family protein, partial [Stellaceae bacterium]